MKFFHKHISLSKKGFTNIELLLVILAGILIVSIAAKMSSEALGGAKRAKVLRGLTRLRSNIQQLYVTQKNYSGLTLQKVINAGAVPSEFVIQGAKVKHPIGGEIQLGLSGNQQFYIQILSIPADECHNILGVALSDDWNEIATGSGSNFTKVTSAVSATCPDKGGIRFYSR